MAERINITVPNDLHERLQAVRDRINISRICQEAIEQAVALEEIKMKALSNKEKVIERLRLERQKSEDDWFEAGRTDGLRDSENLSYDDFQEILDLYQAKNELEKYDQWIEINQFPEDFHELLEERMGGYSPKPIKKTYLAGWIEGVTDFWNEIEAEIWVHAQLLG